MKMCTIYLLYDKTYIIELQCYLITRIHKISEGYEHYHDKQDDEGKSNIKGSFLNNLYYLRKSIYKNK